jgi:hypothetical protein
VILTPARVQALAARCRSLPDEVLAEIFIDRLLRAEIDEEDEDASDAPEPPADGDAIEYVKRSVRIDRLVAFLTVKPGSPMRKIMAHLGLKRAGAHYVVDRAIEVGRIERRGTYNSTKYYALPPQSADDKPSVLLTEQHIDGQNVQRLVRVERRPIGAKQ